MQRKRNECIMLTLTKTEKEQIKAMAAAADLPMTMYCRKILMDKVAENNEQFRTI